jgi:hypothetical protein
MISRTRAEGRCCSVACAPKDESASSMALAKGGRG